MSRTRRTAVARDHGLTELRAGAFRRSAGAAVVRALTLAGNVSYADATDAPTALRHRAIGEI